jgi:hypothetical protein
MTREQLTAQEGQQDPTTIEAAAPDVQGLPPWIYHQVMSLKPTPAGAEALADLMNDQDGVFSERIARFAASAPNLGNHIVQAAIQIAQSRARAGAAPAHPRPPSDVIAQDDLIHLDASRQLPTLSAQLRDQVMALGPDDVPQLARLIAQCPSSQHEALLMAARTTLGSAMVAKALEITQHGGAPTGEVSPAAHDTAPAAHDTAPAAHGTAPAAHGTESPTAGAAPATNTSAGKPVLSAAGVAAAEAYNRVHADWVQEFDALTNYACHVEDGHGELAPKAIALWQHNHGLDADGKIGPRTMQKARQVRASEQHQVASAAPQADARPPV